MVELSVLQSRFGAGITESVFRDNRRIDVASASLFEILSGLKAEFGFSMLIDMTAVDWLEYEGATDRFSVVYLLLNMDTGERLTVRTAVNLPDPCLPSVYSLWRGVDWMEREVYDMFGISFTGHPDLRRLLMPEEFDAYPLRKDYPLKGRGERHNFPVITRSGS